MITSVDFFYCRSHFGFVNATSSI